MSQEFHAFLPHHRIPTRDMWQAAVEAMGLPLVIDPALVPREAGGYCPVLVAGRPSGCEIDLEDALSLLDSHPLLEGRVDEAASVLTLRLAGGAAEGACAFGLAAALVAAFGAVLFDPQSDTLFDGPDELTWEARGLLDGLPRG